VLGISNSLDNKAVTANPDESVASCVPFLREKAPDLAEVVEAWDHLPEAIKAGILAMVQALGGDDV